MAAVSADMQIANAEVFMNRYILRFYKKGNMRFISHLDLQTLFHRAIKRGDVKVMYSNGYNPHELISIVSPLSLGFESIDELLEIDTLIPYDCEDLMARLNLAMPIGISFTSCKELERKNQNTSCQTINAVYEVEIRQNTSFDLSKLNIDEFLNRPYINIFKRDKKTKTMVEKDVKALVNGITLNDGKLIVDVACASNSTVNPVNLLASLYSFSGFEFKPEEYKITRIKLNMIEK